MTWYILIFAFIFFLFFVFLCRRDSYSWHNTSFDETTFLFEFERNGIAIIPNVFNEEEIAELRETCTQYTSKQFGSINSPYKRKDKILPLHLMKPFLKKLYDKNPSFWESVFPNYRIAECSLLTSYNGAKNQPWHSDTEYNEKHAKLVSIGIALDNIDHFMGPLEVFPGTHKNTATIFQPYVGEYLDGYLQGVWPHKCTCSAGSLVFWSSNVLHRGSANTSKKERPVFYFSLLEPHKPAPIGATYSLCKEDKKYIHVFNDALTTVKKNSELSV